MQSSSSIASSSTLSPKFLAPSLQAATLFYQTWYCFVGGSRFYIKIEKLHKQYGPVIRIGPDEVQPF